MSDSRNVFHSSFNGTVFAKPEGFSDTAMWEENQNNLLKTEGGYLFRKGNSAEYGIPEGGLSAPAPALEASTQEPAVKRGRPAKQAETVE